MSLRMRDVVKSYGSFTVLKGVDLTVEPGEVHALLGPNGAGKSTLIKCVGGVVVPDSGTITLDGRPLADLSPARAFDAGIATIHQHLSLIDVLSVVDNLFLGQEMRGLGVIDRRGQLAQARELLERFGIAVSPKARVGDLPMGTKQLLEIAKAWHRTSVRVLILDEPTASLSQSESERLFTEVAKMKEMGARIIYTTHRLGEVFRIADRLTVIRDGAVAMSRPVAEVRPDEIVAAISGAVAPTKRATRAAATGPPVLELSGLRGPRFGPIDLDVRAGEIVGLYGVLGSGRSSLLETLAGRFRATGGTATVGGRAHRPRTPAAALRTGVALVPSDRLRQALLGSRSAADNLLLPSFTRLGTLGVRRASAERATFARIGERVDLQPLAPRRKGAEFSGGNQQKLILGRWLAQADRLGVLLLDEPTQGVDVGARRQIYDVCRELADRGLAVVFASSDAQEVAELAERAVVVEEGRAVAEFTGDAITESTLLDRAHQFTGVTTDTVDAPNAPKEH
ncbi:sugar ABC transporter ATP-binding protein [Nocardiopsis ansamitocini]|uniref:Ribose ABC transporter ATP-binding protein n=1 Tax=Nocardiopsis ansamitocini TaxID=1670832 RepID=A0A9W6PB67_9ACTN|nr:sugar ABC transporter ATP-binding protein [Nocardiopsis ansamitocini]GLU50337.1 ribose ABC transporter ATP-binding protein [Nocardiopsis ansamitocini]